MYSIDVIIMYTVQKQKYVLSNPNCSAEPTGLCRVVIVGSLGGNVLLMVVVSSKCPFFMGSCELTFNLLTFVEFSLRLVANAEFLLKLVVSDESPLSLVVSGERPLPLIINGGQWKRASFYQWPVLSIILGWPYTG